MIIILPNSLAAEVETAPGDHVVAPSWLSPFTAMSVRYAIDSHSDQEILAMRIKDAMASISARKIAKKRPKITMLILPNSKAPKGVPAEVKEGVDKWIFPSERLRALYPHGLKNAIVEPPVDKGFSAFPTIDEKARRYAWVGPIDGNTERLKKAIEWINSRPEECSLLVFGEGKAGNVMPAVRLARSIENPDRIAWMGQKFSPADCKTPFTAIIQAGLDPTPLENKLKSHGLPLINIYQSSNPTIQI
ncbi:MAG: hypothetical protein NC102_08690 [Clostridium sp.]|nr:hypothetical protein [Clostridium sp.]